MTLEELLVEEETVSECKNSNQNLLNFLEKEENLEKLIKFVIEDPTDPNDKNSSYKYASLPNLIRFPFVSADILSNNNRLTEILLKEDLPEPPV